MKQEVQVADHHREDILIEEYLCPEEEIFGVTRVENEDMYHGTILITEQ